MLIIDSNQLFITSMTLAKDVFDEKEVKIVMLNSLRDNVKKFKQYGEVVVASDSKSYWRNSFPVRTTTRQKEDRCRQASLATCLHAHRLRQTLQ